MNIRKHWKKICLAVTAFFWTGCSDSEATAPAQPPVVTADSNSSGELYSSSSEPEMIPVSSSSEIPMSSMETSSSSLESLSSSSSSLSRPYKLASDTTVNCGDSYGYKTSQYCVTVTKSPHTDSCETAMDTLTKSNHLDSAEVFNYEDKLLECGDDDLERVVAVYGVPDCWTKIETYDTYSCDNGFSYEASDMHLEDGLIYTENEYNEKYPSSSSSIEESSSSAEDTSTTCLLKTEYSFDRLVDSVSHELYLEIVQKLDSGECDLSAEDRDTLETFLIRKYELLTITTYDLRELSFDGYVLKTKACSDGTETLTDMYQRKHDEIRSAIQALIKFPW